jgi:hypothetical protein
VKEKVRVVGEKAEGNPREENVCVSNDHVNRKVVEDLSGGAQEQGRLRFHSG